MQYYSSNYSRILPTNSDGATMSRIHPATCVVDTPHDPSPSSSVTTLTVWNRSSMSFQGTDGFTVFDQHGHLAFRVDNYARKTNRYISGAGGGLVLMDGSGHPLLTLKPQILSMQSQWNGYKGENESVKSPKSRMFTLRKPSVLIHKKACEAEVYMETGGSASETGLMVPDFRIEGSFRRRNCKIRNSAGQVAAKILRKRAANTTLLLSDDVFSLVVEPGFDSELMMAFVIILDRICGKPFAPVLCS